MASDESATAHLSAYFRAIFDSEFAYVCRALRRLGVQERDLKDVAQELFVAVHAQVATYDRSRPIKPWLYSFAIRFAANYRRLARHRTDPAESTSTDEGGLAKADVEARDLVLRALETLSFDRKAVIVMHDLEGFAAPEIASLLSVPLNTVYSRLRLAREDFRTYVTREQTRRGEP